MSRAATGDFGGSKRRQPDGYVGFDVFEDGEEFVATGTEPNFNGEGRGPTAALAIADYCEQFDASTRGESD